MAYSEVKPKLFLGNQYSTSVIENVDLIISIGCNSKNKKIENIKFSIKDSSSSDFTSIFKEITDIINLSLENGGSVLVHCQGGINRSPTIIMAYLIRFDGMSLDMAASYLISKRKSIRIQPHYMLQLQKWCDNGFQ